MSNKIKPNRSISRAFLIICLLLIIIDMPLTLIVDNQYTSQLRDYDIENTTSIIYFFLHHPTLAKIGHEDVLRAIEDERMHLQFSTKPKYTNVFKTIDCTSADNCKLQYSQINHSLKNTRLNQPHAFLKFSYYIAPAKIWLNFHFMKRSYPILAIVLVVVEIAIVFISLTYILSIYRFSKPWQKIKELSTKLGLPLARKTTPFFGPTIIKQSVFLMELMAQKIEHLINERVKTIASLSHDIRTPLTRAQFYLHEIKNSDVANKLQQQFDEIQYFLNQTLSYAKQDYQEEPKRKLELISLLETICQDMVEAKKSVLFHSEINRFPFLGQKIGLTRALRNLIENGIKYGEKVEVTISAEAEGVKIYIDDQGPGLPEDMLTKVMQPFVRYQFDKNNKASGTGLGLVIAKSIIENNNGKINLINNHPVGLRVIVRLWQRDEQEKPDEA